MKVSDMTFCGTTNTKEHKSVDVNLIAGELMSFE
jgi:hypothetical protein